MNNMKHYYGEYRPLGKSDGYIAIAKITDINFKECFFKVYNGETVSQYKVYIRNGATLGKGAFPANIEDITLSCIGVGNIREKYNNFVRLCLVEVDSYCYIAIKIIQNDYNFSKCFVSDVEFYTESSSNNIESIYFLENITKTFTLSEPTSVKECIYNPSTSGMLVSFSPNNNQYLRISIGKYTQHLYEIIYIANNGNISTVTLHALWNSSTKSLKGKIKNNVNLTNIYLYEVNTDNEWTIFIRFRKAEIINIKGLSGYETFEYSDSLPSNAVELKNRLIVYPYETLDKNNLVCNSDNRPWDNNICIDTNLQKILFYFNGRWNDALGSSPHKNIGDYKDRPNDSSRAFPYYAADKKQEIRNFYGTWYNNGKIVLDKDNYKEILSNATYKLNSDFIVFEDIDLNNESLSLPEGSRLYFLNNVRLKNGTVIGNSSTIVDGIFENIIVSGTFKALGNIVRYKGSTENRPILTASIDGFEYYDTTIKKKILWNGTTWVNIDGSSLDIKKSGATNARPTNVDIGFIYKDTTLNKLILWDGTKWVNLDGTELA